MKRGASVEKKPMLIKMISCLVPREQRRAFEQAQERWRELQTVPGFGGQIGGWTMSLKTHACILAFWKSQPLYQQFMEHDHDRILEISGQSGTYQSITIQFFEQKFDIPGRHDYILAALTAGKWLQITKLTVADLAVTQFSDWRHDPDFLAGVVGCRSTTAEDWLVATLWTKPEPPDVNWNHLLPSETTTIALAPSWLVIPKVEG